VAGERVGVRPNDLRDLGCVGTADDCQLHRFVLVFAKELGDPGAGRDRVDVHIGEELLPGVDQPVQYVFAERFLPYSDG